MLRRNFIQCLFEHDNELEVDVLFHRILLPNQLSLEIEILNTLMSYKCSVSTMHHNSGVHVSQRCGPDLWFNATDAPPPPLCVGVLY